MPVQAEAAGPMGKGRTPALVVGSGITALGVMRTLGRAGIPVYLADRVPDGTRLSRWHREAPGWKSGESWPDLEAYLSSGPLETAVLIPCSDHSALEVTRLAPEISRRFPSYLPPVESLQALTDKSCLYRLLDAEEIPFPRTWMDPSEEELEAFSRDGSRRVFLKPYDSQSFFRKYGVKGMWLRGAMESWPPAVREVLRSGGVVAQEYVPGPPSNHYFIDGFALEGGQVTARLVRRRLRMYPTDFGNSSYMVTVPEDEAAEAVEALDRLLKILGYRGIFSAEFKRDEGDGTFRLLEVNARAWWFVEFSARCGVDTVGMSYQAALGHEVGEAFEYALGRRLSHPYYDIQACWATSGNPITGVLRFLSSLPGAIQPTFQLSDPGPALGEGWRFTKSFFRRRLGGLLRRGQREDRA